MRVASVAAKHGLYIDTDGFDFAFTRPFPYPQVKVSLRYISYPKFFAMSPTKIWFLQSKRMPKPRSHGLGFFVN